MEIFCDVQSNEMILLVHLSVNFQVCLTGTIYEWWIIISSGTGGVLLV